MQVAREKKYSRQRRKDAEGFPELGVCLAYLKNQKRMNNFMVCAHLIMVIIALNWKPLSSPPTERVGVMGSTVQQEASSPQQHE